MVVFRTKRLVVRTAGVEDAGLFLALWNDPRVMTNVGFPWGLKMSLEEVQTLLHAQSGKAEYGRNLVAELPESGILIGECKMYRPDEEGISRTDVKLLPEHWGIKFGVEIKRGLLDYLFRNTTCKAVEGTPNVENVASIKMQEAVGGVRVGEATGSGSDRWGSLSRPVHHYIYLVYREVWEQLKTS